MYLSLSRSRVFCFLVVGCVAILLLSFRKIAALGGSSDTAIKNRPNRRAGGVIWVIQTPTFVAASTLQVPIESVGHMPPFQKHENFSVSVSTAASHVVYFSPFGSIAKRESERETESGWCITPKPNHQESHI